MSSEMNTPQQNRISGFSSSLAGFGRLFASASALKSYVSIADRLILGGTNFVTFAIIGRACGLEDLGIFALAWTVILTVSVLHEAFVYSPFTIFAAQKRREGLHRPYSGCALSMHTLLSIVILSVLGTASAVASALGVSDAETSTALATLLAIPFYALREFARRYVFAGLKALPVLALDAFSCAFQLAALGALWAYDVLSVTDPVLAAHEDHANVGNLGHGTGVMPRPAGLAKRAVAEFGHRGFDGVNQMRRAKSAVEGITVVAGDRHVAPFGNLVEAPGQILRGVAARVVVGCPEVH